MSDVPPFPAARLLAHADFLYRLGARLAGRDDGDDLAHDTWLAAAERLPSAGNERGWLAAVMENLWRNRQRGERRRAARDSARSSEGSAPDVGDIVAVEELRQRIVAAVVALPPLLRDVVLLRYHEGLDSRSIGARLHVAPSTVRTRHQDAMRALRERLDSEHGGRRAAWAGLLLRWHASVTAPVRAAVPLAAWLAVAACTVLVAWYVAWPDAPVPAATVRSVADTGATIPAATDAAQGSPDVARVERSATASAEPAPSAGYPWTRPVSGLHGFARDAADGLPAADADVVVRAVPLDCSPFVNVPEAPRIERRARTGADGTFVVDDLPVGCYDVDVFADAARHGFVRANLGTVPRRVEIVVLAKPERGHVAVRVVDAAGAPVAAADVELALGGPRGGWAGWPARLPFRGVTDANGRFELQRDDLDGIERGAARARDATGRVGYADLNRSNSGASRPYGIEVVVRPAGALAGRLSGVPSWRSVRVVAHPAPRAAFTEPACFDVAAPVAADGSYRIEGLAPGEYTVQVDGLARRADNEQFWNTPATRVEAGETAIAVPPDLACVAGATIAGTVVAGDGAPIEGALVTARRPWVNGLGCWVLHHEEREAARWFLEHTARTTANGTYELALPAGEWQVLVTAPGRTMDAQLGVVAEGGVARQLRHVLVADGALAGSLPADWVLRQRAHPDVMHLVPSFFHVRGLRAGTWELGPYDRPGGTFTARATAEVVAGRTTWIDCTRADERVHRGVLRHAGMPLAGYDVSIERDGVPVRTGADGSFELHDAQARAEQPTLHVRNGGLRVGVSEQLDGVIELPGRMVEVRTTSPEGQPEAATIAIGNAFDHQEKYEINDPDTVRCPDGVLRFLLAQPTEFTHVIATFDDGSRARVAVAEQRSLTIVRPVTGAVAVNVVDAAAMPLSGWSVRALAWGHGDAAPGDAAAFVAGCTDRAESVVGHTDAAGRVLLRGVQRGPALVEAWAPGARQGLGGRQRIVTVAAGKTLDVELRPK